MASITPMSPKYVRGEKISVEQFIEAKDLERFFFRAEDDRSEACKALFKELVQRFGIQEVEYLLVAYSLSQTVIRATWCIDNDNLSFVLVLDGVYLTIEISNIPTLPVTLYIVGIKSSS